MAARTRTDGVGDDEPRRQCVGQGGWEKVGDQVLLAASMDPKQYRQQRVIRHILWSEHVQKEAVLAHRAHMRTRALCCRTNASIGPCGCIERLGPWLCRSRLAES